MPGNYSEVGGVPFAVSDEQAQELVKAGAGKPISQQEAVSGKGALNDLANTSDTESAIMGLGSGLSMGIGPGLGVAAGLIDPDKVGAAQASPWYTAGDVAGMVLPSIFTGGEAAAARGGVAAERGLLGSVLRYSPAGLVNLGGNAAERAALGVLGETGGALGRIAKPAMGLAARGAAEGAAINLGHTIGDNLVQNKPMASEALLAATIDGALFGSLMGGGLGVVGGVGGLAAEGIGNAIGRSGGKDLGVVGRRLGMSAEDVTSAEAAPGGFKGRIRQAQEILDDAGTGAKIGSSNEKIATGYKTARAGYEAAEKDIYTTLNKEAPSATPQIELVNSRLDQQIVMPKVGSIQEAEALKGVTEVKELLSGVKGWKGWLDTAKALQSGEVKIPFRMEVSNIVQDSIANAMRDAGKAIGQDGIAERWAANLAKNQLAKELEASIGKKAAGQLLHEERGIHPRDAAVAGAILASGHPVSAPLYLASKSLSKGLGAKLEPWMAQMAYDASFGTKAANAEASFKVRAGEAVKNFFKRPGKVASTVKADYGRKSAGKDTRAEYEAAVARTEQLMAMGHKMRMNNYANELAVHGYPEMAKELMGINQRAQEYLGFNMPPTMGGMNSLRKQPKIHGINQKEHQYLRLESIVKNPNRIFSMLEDGSLGADEARAYKYVYPESHKEIVSNVMQQVAEMKAEGKSLPVDKITQLGIVLDSPVDSILEPSYINAIQVAINSPVDSDPQPEPQTMPVPQSIQSTGLMTQAQQTLV